MADFSKLLKLVGKGVEEVVPKADDLAKTAKSTHFSALPDDVVDLSKMSEARLKEKLNKLNDRRAQTGSSPLTMEQFKAYETKREMPIDPMVENKPPTPVAESGPATLADSNKLYNPEMSGIVNYAKKPSTAKAMMPMAAAGDLFTDLQNSPLGDAATQWNKIKTMMSDKAAKEMDLTGGKDPQFQKAASTVLGTALDPINLIPGAGGVAAGAAEMLAREPQEETPEEKMKKKLQGMP